MFFDSKSRVRWDQLQPLSNSARFLVGNVHEHRRLNFFSYCYRQQSKHQSYLHSCLAVIIRIVHVFLYLNSGFSKDFWFGELFFLNSSRRISVYRWQLLHLDNWTALWGAIIMKFAIGDICSRCHQRQVCIHLSSLDMDNRQIYIIKYWD